MANTLIERINLRLAELGKTERQASIEASGHADAIRNIRRAKTLNPRSDTLAKLAVALETTPQWLLNGEGPEAAAGPRRDEAMPFTPPPTAPRQTGRALGVYGLAAGAIAGQLTMTNEPIEYVTAPHALENVRDAYALIVTGSSMEPRYFAGDVIFLHPHRPVRPGDHVVIQEALHGGTVVSIKRFERMTDGFVVTTQYNPLAEVKFRRETVIAMHRVLTPNEVAGV